MLNRNRLRINENIDENLLNKLDYVSKLIDLPRSRIVEEGIRHVLKKQLIPSEKTTYRKSINLTINKELWITFKDYSQKNNCKLVHLLEEAIRYSLKKYLRKLVQNKK